MQVGELASQTGASIRSLRYYEQEGLLPAHRRANGYREFEPAAREQVQRIRALLAIDLTLAEVRRLAPCLKDQRSEIPLCQAALEAYQRQLATLDERIHPLQEIRQRIMDYLDASDVPDLMFRGLKRLEVEWDEDFI
jgi:DNA-binding transcriptional MerR regulator